MRNRVVTIQENVVLFYFSPVDTLFSDYVSRAPAALRMTDNEVLSSHSGGERQHLQPTSNSSNSSRSPHQHTVHTSSQQRQQRNRHAPVSSSRSISLGDTPESRIEEDSEDRASNEAKDHSADDEGEDEEDFEKEEGFSSATSSPVKLPPPPPPHPANVGNRLQGPAGNHVLLSQDIDIELGEVCTAITKYAMSNKNANVDIEAVEKHELTPHVPPVGVPPGVVGHSIINNSKPLDGTPMDNGGDPESDPPDLSATKETEDCDVGYITQLDKDGNPQLVPIKFEGEAEDEPNPLADFMSGDILAKPFTFVSGNTKKSRFNPFRKKSGLLNVLARQSTKNRICFKNGYLNTFTPSEENQAHKFLQDIFVSIIDLNWGWIYVIFAAAFFLSWLGFAIVWYLTFWVHGDFADGNLGNETYVPCASAITGFTSCFLFSLETQHTIGYGGRATTEECPLAIIVMSTQSIIGVIIQACMAGIIFAKFTVPRKRGQTLVFSKNAVITMRNGSLYLISRVCDLRKSALLEAHVRMVIIKKEVTDEGETIPYQLADLTVTTEIEEENDRVLILWPVTIAHKIDEDSPLYDMNPRDILNSQFEVIMTLEGVTEETGNTVQVRTSYLPNEILWGHKFDHNVLVYDKKMGSYQIFHSRVNKTAMDDTPRLSARQLDMRSKRNSSGLSNSTTTENSPSKKPFKRLPTMSDKKEKKFEHH